MRTTIRVMMLFASLLASSLSFAGWQRVNTGTETLNCITAHHAFTTGKVWACGNDGVILYSSNGGDTWTYQNSGTFADLYTITFKEISGGPVFAAGESGVILRTTNDGTTWTQIASGTTATLRDHSDFGWIIVGDSGIALRSTDNGLSWARKQTGTAARLYSVAATSSIYAVGENGIVLKGFNGGETWQVTSTGMRERLLGVPMFGSLNYAVGSGGLALKSSDFGSSWQILRSRTNSTLRSAEFSVNNTSRIYAVGDNGTILKTTDAGESWGRQESPTRANLRSVFFYLNDNVGFACGNSGVILKTTDGGGAFIPVPDSLEDMFPLAVGNQWDYSYSWTYDDYLSSLLTSLTGTARLTVLGATHSSDSTRWLLQERVEGTYCIRYYWPPVYDTCYSTVRTTTFDLIERRGWRHRLYRNIPHYDCWNSLVPFGRDLVEPSFIYRYAYPDSGNTTRIHPQDQPVYASLFYNVLMKADSGLATIQSRTGYLVGSSFRSNHRLITGTLLDVPDRLLAAIPVRYKLEQNYPNPFNPKTSFRFEVPSSKLVTLKVYDLLGREVATLVNEMKEPGTYEVSWDASSVASGVYFYQLRSGVFHQTRKLIVLR